MVMDNIESGGVSVVDVLHDTVKSKFDDFVRNYGLDGESLVDGRDVPYSEVLGALACIRDVVVVVADNLRDTFGEGLDSPSLNFDDLDISVGSDGELSEGAKVCRSRVLGFVDSVLSSLDEDMGVLVCALHKMCFVSERERDHVRLWLDAAAESHMAFAKAWRYILEWLDAEGMPKVREGSDGGELDGDVHFGCSC